MSQQQPRLSSMFKLEYPQSVGVYGTYDEAQQVVDYLADARFPVENLCIVGTELKSIERVLGRRSWGTVVGTGVQTGLSTGLMITLVMWLLNPGTNFLVLAIYALGIGIAIGIVMAALSYWMSQGKRDFTSVSQTMATKYELLAEHKVATQAREIVATMPRARAAQFHPVPQGYPQPGHQPAPGGYLPPAPGYGQPPAGYPQPPQGQPYGGYPPPAYGNYGWAAPQPPAEPVSGPTPPTPGEPDQPAEDKPSNP